MSANIPAHIQQQFLSDIQELHDNVGQEAAKAYLKSLFTDASLDMFVRRKSSWYKPFGEATHQPSLSDG